MCTVPEDESNSLCVMRSHAHPYDLRSISASRMSSTIRERTEFTLPRTSDTEFSFLRTSVVEFPFLRTSVVEFTLLRTSIVASVASPTNVCSVAVPFCEQGGAGRFPPCTTYCWLRRWSVQKDSSWSSVVVVGRSSKWSHVITICPEGEYVKGNSLVPGDQSIL